MVLSFMDEEIENIEHDDPVQGDMMALCLCRRIYCIVTEEHSNLLQKAHANLSYIYVVHQALIEKKYSKPIVCTSLASSENDAYYSNET